MKTLAELVGEADEADRAVVHDPLPSEPAPTDRDERVADREAAAAQQHLAAYGRKEVVSPSQLRREREQELLAELAIEHKDAKNRAVIQKAINAHAKLKVGMLGFEVLERLAAYARDPDHPHHMYALDFLAKRAFPADMMVVGGEVDGQPMKAGVVINVVGAAPREVGRTIDAEESEQ